MARIITVTLNPAIDKSVTVPAMIPDKKLRCTSPVLEAGGGGINVTRALKRLGSDAIALYLAGGYQGELLKQLLNAEDIRSEVIKIHHSTRENVIILDKSRNQQYRLGMPGPEIEEVEWKECLKKLAGHAGIDYLIASGSLPPGIPDTIFGQMAAIANLKRAKLIVDTSGEALRHAVKEGVYLLKPNLGELAVLTGKAQMDHKSIVATARTIIGKGGCEVMIVSMGASGAILITDKITERLVPPPVRRKSTVGAGDSMVAGIVHSLSNGGTLSEAFRYGIAAGTAATMNAGTELCHLKDVQKLYKQLL